MAAPNAARGHLGFEVEGQSFTLCFSTNALCAIEEEFDLRDIRDIGPLLTESPSIRNVRRLFRLGLFDHHPDMPDSAAGPLIDAIGGIMPAAELLMIALQNAFPQAKEAAEGTAHPPKPTGGRGTGRSSTRPGAKSGAIPSSSGG